MFLAGRRALLSALCIVTLSCSGAVPATTGASQAAPGGHWIHVMTKTDCHPVWVSAEEEQRSRERDQAEARRYVASCQAGDPSSCGLAADAYRNGRGVPVDVRQADALARRAVAGYGPRCDQGDTSACFVLAFAYEKGEGAGRDAERALTLYRRARDLDEGRCQADDAAACQRLGDLLGGWNPVRDYDRRAPLYERARALYARECARGIAASCNRTVE